MKFANDDNKRKFLNDIPYYASSEDFCLGKTFTEAADVIRSIGERKDVKYVGVDNQRVGLDIENR